MIWPFNRKPKPLPFVDVEETWRQGDIAECMTTFDGVPEAPRPGAKLIVIGFACGKVLNCDYATVGLRFPGLLLTYEANAFRKVVPGEQAEDRKVSDALPAKSRERVQ